MMYWGYFQSFTICIFLPPLLLIMKLARRKGAREALQEAAARHCYISGAKIQQSRVRGWWQGHCWVGWRKKGKDEPAMLLVWENLKLVSGLSQPPVQSHHPTENIAFGILISLHYLSSLSIHLLYNSLWLEVVVHLGCLWILTNGVKLIQRLSTHFRFSLSTFPKQLCFGKSLQLNLLLKFLKITCKVRTPFRCFVLFTRKIKLIFPSLLLWMVLFCNTIDRKKVLSFKKMLFLLTSKGSLPQ